MSTHAIDADHRAAQGQHRFDQLEQIGHIEHREAELPPVAAGLVSEPGRISGGGEIHAKDEVDPLF